MKITLTKVAQSLVFTTLLGMLSACSTLYPEHQLDNNALFAEFTLLPLSTPDTEQAILDTAYHTLQQLYPTSLVTPLHFENSYAFVVDVEDIDKGLYDFNFAFGDPPWQPYVYHWQPYAYQVRLTFEQVLGKTLEGSIITGYRYQINVIPRSLSLFYLDDGSEEIDLVFRSELMKNRIQSINVTKVI